MILLEKIIFYLSALNEKLKKKKKNKSLEIYELDFNQKVLNSKIIDIQSSLSFVHENLRDLNNKISIQKLELSELRKFVDSIHQDQKILNINIQNTMNFVSENIKPKGKT